MRGGEIVGNVTRQKLVAGDVASAPAGVPHFWEVENGKSVTYLTVKLGKKALNRIGGSVVQWLPGLNPTTLNH